MKSKEFVVTDGLVVKNEDFHLDHILIFLIFFEFKYLQLTRST